MIASDLLDWGALPSAPDYWKVGSLAKRCVTRLLLFPEAPPRCACMWHLISECCTIQDNGDGRMTVSAHTGGATCLMGPRAMILEAMKNENIGMSGFSSLSVGHVWPGERLPGAFDGAFEQC